MRRFVGLSLALVVILATAVTAQTKAASKPGGKAAEGPVRVNPGRFRVKSYDSPTDPALNKLASQSALASITANEKPIVSVPQSFLGLSIDLNDIEGIAHRDFIGIIKRLTGFDTGPLYMRVGAYSADRLIKPWPATVYKALTQLNKATGVQYIIGVNQHAEDPKITAGQVERSLKLLPAGSIVSFGVGNEPDMYNLPARDGLPGSALPKPDNWLGTKWISVSKVVYRAAFEAAGKKRMLSGPDWSDSHMEDKKLSWWIANTKDFLNMVTVHHYGGNILKDTSIQGLLDDARIVNKLSNLKNLIKVCQANGNLPLRITESATLSYGGVMGISDTAGAALWALDTALEVAYTGSAGIHFHQVLSRDGNANYNAIYYQASENRVRARLPIYGYLMLQQTLAGGADILGRSISGACKVWLLKARKSGELRALVLNKVDGKECAADVKMSVDQLRRYSGDAEAHYMYGSDGLQERWRVYYSDSFFEDWGSDKTRPLQTAPVSHYLARDAKGKVSGGGFAVHITTGTIAALVLIPPSTPAQQKAFDAALKAPAPPPAAANATNAKPAANAANAKPAAAAGAAAAAAKPAADAKPAAKSAAPAAAAAAKPKQAAKPAKGG